jgi:hypothetical protein
MDMMRVIQNLVLIPFSSHIRPPDIPLQILKHIIEHVDSTTAMNFMTKKKILHYSALCAEICTNNCKC